MQTARSGDLLRRRASVGEEGDGSYVVVQSADGVDEGVADEFWTHEEEAFEKYGSVRVD